MKRNIDAKICVVGLGYVGLPLACEFGKKYPTLGFDIDENRCKELGDGFDRTGEISSDEITLSSMLSFTNSEKDLPKCNVFIITVPTPIDKYKQPDLTPLMEATSMVGKILKHGDLVIYESTVFPGATEEFCVPILEKKSGLVFNLDFHCGYSPERINPGDKDRRIKDIVKVTSGSSYDTLETVDALYSSIIVAGTYKAPSIKVAEAAKVIENTQRDLNIGLINELSIIFNKMKIDTNEVLEAAGTKWNFLPFKPGLVGGHCIGVDPYYLTYKAQQLGYHPEVILAGRRMNDNMSQYVVGQLIKSMLSKGIEIKSSKILVMGLAFKENCRDIRNTKVIDIITELESYGALVDCFDPWVDMEAAKKEFDIHILNDVKQKEYDAILLAVAHKQFKEMSINDLHNLCNPLHVIFDLKNILPKHESDFRL